MLQTRGDMREWIEHIQHGISHQLNTQMQSEGLEPEAAAQVDELIAFPGNDVCADCGAASMSRVLLHESLPV